MFSMPSSSCQTMVASVHGSLHVQTARGADTARPAPVFSCVCGAFTDFRYLENGQVDALHAESRVKLRSIGCALDDAEKAVKKIQADLIHPNLVAVLGLCQQDGSPYVVLETTGRTLEEEIARGFFLGRGVRAWSVAKDVVTALFFLHDNMVSHSNLSSTTVVQSAPNALEWKLINIDSRMNDGNQNLSADVSAFCNLLRGLPASEAVMSELVQLADQSDCARRISREIRQSVLHSFFKMAKPEIKNWRQRRRNHDHSDYVQMFKAEEQKLREEYDRVWKWYKREYLIYNDEHDRHSKLDVFRNLAQEFAHEGKLYQPPSCVNGQAANGQAANALDNLLEIARSLDAAFQTKLEDITVSVCENCAYCHGPVKKKERALAKVREYEKEEVSMISSKRIFSRMSPDPEAVRRLVDVVRGSAVCLTLQELCDAMRALRHIVRTRADIVIRRFKDRVTKPLPWRHRDVSLNVAMSDVGLIGELQMTLEKFWDVRTDIEHEVYEIRRANPHLLEVLDIRACLMFRLPCVGGPPNPEQCDVGKKPEASLSCSSVINNIAETEVVDIPSDADSTKLRELEWRVRAPACYHLSFHQQFKTKDERYLRGCADGLCRMVLKSGDFRLVWRVANEIDFAELRRVLQREFYPEKKRERFLVWHDSAGDLKGEWPARHLRLSFMRLRYVNLTILTTALGVSENPAADRAFVRAALVYDGTCLQFTGINFRQDRELVLTAVVQNGLALKYTDEQNASDREVVLAAVGQNGRALEYAAAELKKDRAVVLAAIQRNGSVPQYANPELKNASDFVLAPVCRKGDALQYAHADLKKDRAFMLAAVQQDGGALQYADVAVKKDREIVLAAVREDGGALEYADAEMQKDREVVLAAVQNNGWAFEYADAELKEAKDVALVAVQRDGRVLQYTCAELKKDPEVVLAAVTQSGCALEYASAELKNDRDIVLAAVRQSGWVLHFADAELRKAREIVLAAVQQFGFALGTVDVKAGADPHSGANRDTMLEPALSFGDPTSNEAIKQAAAAPYGIAATVSRDEVDEIKKRAAHELCCVIFDPKSSDAATQAANAALGSFAATTAKGDNNDGIDLAIYNLFHVLQDSESCDPSKQTPAAALGSNATKKADTNFAIYNLILALQDSESCDAAKQVPVAALGSDAAKQGVSVPIPCGTHIFADSASGDEKVPEVEESTPGCGGYAEGTPLVRLEGMGAATIERLKEIGIYTVEALATIDITSELCRSLVKNLRSSRAIRRVQKMREHARRYLNRRYLNSEEYREQGASN